MDIIINSPNSPVAFSLLDYPIRYYGVLMSFVFIFGVLIAYFLFKFKKSKNQAEIFLDYSPLIILISILGARLFYVFASVEYYLEYPLEIFMINHGGLSIFGAIFFGLLGLFCLSKKKNFNFLSHCDILAVVFPLCQSIGRFGNYFNQEAFGKPTDGFIKLFVDVAYRPLKYQNIQFFHPTFLYESILDLIVFAVLMSLLFKINLKNGMILLVYLCLYSFIRFFIEGIRVDSALNIGNIPIVQIICVFVFLTSLSFIFLFNKKRTK